MAGLELWCGPFLKKVSWNKNTRATQNEKEGAQWRQRDVSVYIMPACIHNAIWHASDLYFTVWHNDEQHFLPSILHSATWTVTLHSLKAPLMALRLSDMWLVRFDCFLLLQCFWRFLTVKTRRSRLQKGTPVRFCRLVHAATAAVYHKVNSRM